MTVYTQRYEQWSGRAKPGQPIGRVGELIKHTEAGADISPSATVAQEVARCRAIDAFHRSLGWGGCGYQAIDFPSGRIYEGRGFGRSGVHTAGRNFDSVATCTAGHGDRHPMTAGGVQIVRRWIAEGIRAGHLTDQPKVTGHRDYAAKSCPGNRIYPQLPQLRDVTVDEEHEMTPTQERKLDQALAQLGEIAERLTAVEEQSGQAAHHARAATEYRGRLRRDLRRIAHRLQIPVPAIQRWRDTNGSSGTNPDTFES